MNKNMFFILSGKYFESQMHVLLMLHVVYFFLDAGIILYKKILIIELFVKGKSALFASSQLIS